MLRVLVLLVLIATTLLTNLSEAYQLKYNKVSTTTKRRIKETDSKISKCRLFGQLDYHKTDFRVQAKKVASAVFLSGIFSLQLFVNDVFAVEDHIPSIDLNAKIPRITDTCWLDIEIQDAERKKERVEIGLYGEVMPKTAHNFISLSKNSLGYGYKGSDVFRVVPGFSVQLGNIPQDPSKPETAPALRSREGKAALDEGQTQSFPPESFEVGHKLRGGGVVSMMTDIKKKGAVDSRFFIQIADDASWADNRYPAFGQVTNGMTFVANYLQTLDTKPPSNHPLERVRVVDSGCYDAPKPAPTIVADTDSIVSSSSQ